MPPAELVMDRLVTGVMPASTAISFLPSRFNENAPLVNKGAVPVPILPLAAFRVTVPLAAPRAERASICKAWLPALAMLPELAVRVTPPPSVTIRSTLMFLPVPNVLAVTVPLAVTDVKLISPVVTNCAEPLVSATDGVVTSASFALTKTLLPAPRAPVVDTVIAVTDDEVSS